MNKTISASLFQILWRLVKPLLPLPLQSGEGQYASPCQISWRLVKPLRRHDDLSFFNMAVVQLTGFVVRMFEPPSNGVWWSLSLFIIWLESIWYQYVGRGRRLSSEILAQSDVPPPDSSESWHVLPVITANMQSETGFPSSHQLKSYIASKSHLKLAARAVLSADAGLLV